MEEIEILENINPFIEFDVPIHEMIKSYGIPEDKTKKIIKKFKKHHANISKEIYDLMDIKSKKISNKFDNKETLASKRSKLSELIDHTFLSIIMDEIKNELKYINDIKVQNTYNYVDYVNHMDYRVIITDKKNKKYIFGLDLKNEKYDQIEENSLGRSNDFKSLLYDKHGKLNEESKIKSGINCVPSRDAPVVFRTYEFNITGFIQENITQIILRDYMNKIKINEKLHENSSVLGEYNKIQKQLTKIIKQEVTGNIENVRDVVKNKVDDYIIFVSSYKKPISKTQQNLDKQWEEERKLKERRIKKVNSSNKNKQKPFVLLDKMEDILNGALGVAVFIKSIGDLKSSLKTKVINDIITMFDGIDGNQIAIKKGASTITKFMDKKQIKKINNLKKQFFVKFGVKSDKRSA